MKKNLTENRLRLRDWRATIADLKGQNASIMAALRERRVHFSNEKGD